MAKRMDIVLFICEHGSAKSVVAAAHFNRIAHEIGLSMHALSRGTDPDDVNHPAAIAGLEADGLQAESVPRQLSPTDLAAARKVISFGELPTEYSTEVAVEVWTVPPISDNYELARSSIVGRINQVIDALQRE